MLKLAFMRLWIALLYAFNLLHIAQAVATRSVFEWTTLPLPPACSTLIKSGTLTSTTATITTAPSSCTTVTTYGVDVAWTVTTLKGVVASNTRIVPEVSATLLAVIQDGITMWPPPTLNVSVNQRIRIRLFNYLPAGSIVGEPITLHFHGILQNNNYVSMDGPENVVQCGLKPGSGPFIYDFVASKAGTYWIHSHDPGQYPKGLRSPLIVTDPEEPKSGLYDDEYALTVSDWYSDFWKSEAQYLSSPLGPSDDRGIEIFPQASLFNDYLPGINTSERRITLPVKANIKYRLRFINMSALFQYFVQISDHTVSIIEVDGVRIKQSASTEGFIITPGQRLSVILEGTKTTGAFPIIAVIDSSLNNRGGSHTWGCISYDGSECSAPDPGLEILHRYNKSDISNDMYSKLARARPRLDNKPRVSWNDYLHTSVAYPWNFNERTFEPLDSENIPSLDTLMSVKPGNVHWITLVDMKSPNPDNDTEVGFASMDSALWSTPSVPGLISALNNKTNPEVLTSYGDSTKYSNSILVRSVNDVVWLIFETLRGDHPMHLHGHHFQLLYKGGEHEYGGTIPYKYAVDAFNTRGSADPWWNEFRDTVRGRAAPRPLTRDTIQAERYQLLIVAFVADNPGVWALHCHNDFHARSGMFRQVLEAPSYLRDTVGSWEKTGDYVYKFYGGENLDPVARESWQRNVLHCAF